MTRLYPDNIVPQGPILGGKATIRPLRPLNGPSKRPVQVDDILHGAALEGDNTIIALDVWGRRGNPDLRGNRDGRTRMQRDIALPLNRPGYNEVKWTPRDLHRTNLEDRGPNAYEHQNMRNLAGDKLLGKPFTSIDAVSGANNQMVNPMQNAVKLVGRPFTSIDSLPGLHNQQTNPMQQAVNLVNRPNMLIDKNSGVDNHTTNVMQNSVSTFGMPFTQIDSLPGLHNQQTNPMQNGATVLGKPFTQIDSMPGLHNQQTNPMQNGASVFGRNLHTVDVPSGLHNLTTNIMQNAASTFGRNFHTVDKNAGLDNRTFGDIHSVENKLRAHIKYVEEQRWGDPNTFNNHGLESTPSVRLHTVVPYVEEHTPPVLRGIQQFQFQPLPIRNPSMIRTII